MTRTRILIALPLSLLALLVTGPALARIKEVGQTKVVNQPACPSNPCLAITRTTGSQAPAGGHHNVSVATSDGRLVAFKLRLGKPNVKERKFFRANFGGDPTARIAVLKPPKKRHGPYTLSGQSPVVVVPIRNFGHVIQFPLTQTLFVRKGYVIALTVPTWLPALSVGLDNGTAWRSTRPKAKCEDAVTQATQTSQQTRGSQVSYDCLYRTARITYSATLISSP